MKRGFTLLEMLVVIGIIVILVGASVGAFSKMSKAAERTKGQELVYNVATALAVMYQNEGAWPKRIVGSGSSDGKLDENVSYAFVNPNNVSGSKYLSLHGDNDAKKTVGLDRFGVITPWATTVLKTTGTKATLATRVSTASDGGHTIDDHILHYALDLDGDGIVSASVGGQSLEIRAPAAVWCAGADGKMESYKVGLKKDDLYSWTPGMVRNR